MKNKLIKVLLVVGLFILGFFLLQHFNKQDREVEGLVHQSDSLNYELKKSADSILYYKKLSDSLDVLTNSIDDRVKIIYITLDSSLAEVDSIPFDSVYNKLQVIYVDTTEKNYPFSGNQVKSIYKDKLILESTKRVVDFLNDRIFIDTQNLNVKDNTIFHLEQTNSILEVDNSIKDHIIQNQTKTIKQQKLYLNLTTGGLIVAGLIIML